MANVLRFSRDQASRKLEKGGGGLLNRSMGLPLALPADVGIKPLIHCFSQVQDAPGLKFERYNRLG